MSGCCSATSGQQLASSMHCSSAPDPDAISPSSLVRHVDSAASKSERVAGAEGPYSSAAAAAPDWLGQRLGRAACGGGDAERRVDGLQARRDGWRDGVGRRRLGEGNGRELAEGVQQLLDGRGREGGDDGGPRRLELHVELRVLKRECLQHAARSANEGSRRGLHLHLDRFRFSGRYRNLDRLGLVGRRGAAAARGGGHGVGLESVDGGRIGGAATW